MENNCQYYYYHLINLSIYSEHGDNNLSCRAYFFMRKRSITYFAFIAFIYYLHCTYKMEALILRGYSQSIVRFLTAIKWICQRKSYDLWHASIVEVNDIHVGRHINTTNTLIAKKIAIQWRLFIPGEYPVAFHKTGNLYHFLLNQYKNNYM